MDSLSEDELRKRIETNQQPEKKKPQKRKKLKGSSKLSFVEYLS